MATAIEYGLIGALALVAGISAYQGISGKPAQRQTEEEAFVARCHNRGGYVARESTGPWTEACVSGPVLERWPVRMQEK